MIVPKGHIHPQKNLPRMMEKRNINIPGIRRAIKVFLERMKLKTTRGSALKKLFMAIEISSFPLYSVFMKRIKNTAKNTNCEMREVVIFIVLRFYSTKSNPKLPSIEYFEIPSVLSV